LLASGLVTGARGQMGTDALTVPRGPVPTLDGVLTPDEWKDARRIKIAGGEILLQYAGGSLYVGLRTTSRAVGSICVDQGDRIAVLHSSAALGTAVYARAGSNWRLLRAFAWRCRHQGDTAPMQAERESFWHDEQWLANNAFTGTPGEMEYRIAVPAGSLRLAVGFRRMTDQILLFWPAEVSDDSRSLDLIGGDAPATLEFLPEEWITVRVAP